MLLKIGVLSLLLSAIFYLFGGIVQILQSFNLINHYRLRFVKIKIDGQSDFFFTPAIRIVYGKCNACETLHKNICICLFWHALIIHIK